MRNVLVCTVGTSLKGNLERSERSDLKELFNSQNFQGLAVGASDLDPEDRLLGAEISSITSILKKNMLDRKDHLYLLVSDTGEGENIGKFLKQYYLSHKNHYQFNKVEWKVVEGLTDASPHLFRTEGLRNLVREIAKIVRSHGSNTILINATGGYKAQISFAGMIGQALEIPVCYLFEKFSEVIELPPQPIAMDLSFWLEHVELFYALAEDRCESDPQGADRRFDCLVDEIEVDGQKHVGLSAVGQLFHETFRYRFRQQSSQLLPPDSGLAPEQKVIKYEDDNKGKHPGLAAWLEKILRIPYVKRIYTYYYNRDLPLQNHFRVSQKGDVSQVEGVYSGGKATTRFEVVTTAVTEAQRDAVLADLNELCR